MIRLHESKKLQILHQSLSEYIPEAMKVYGSIFNIIRGNPFNLEVLVDSWPDYQTVITRPQKKEMMDDKDHYINTYHIFSKDFQKLPAILECNSVINWKQSLTIQGCQNGLNEKIRDVVPFKSIKVDYSKRFLYITGDVLKSITSNASKLMKSNEVTSSENVTFRSTNNNFKPALLDVSHAELVSNNWKFGKNEKSLRFVKRCLQKFPGYCLLGPEGNPITWTIMEHTNELRMVYTLPEYRGKRIAKMMGISYIQHLKENDMPFYCSVEKMNEQSHKLMKSLGFHAMDCGWHEWKCVPDELL
ncbi:glycine N-acyltransferase-like protein 2 [Sminthopsis crassicaudata]|uniref:glycine N-acyltransferase-like protein 2 n=1 Tax=Sminthopsis crassicaudata TaxID=9301 RepID=UPI003D6826E0